jgi:hypothetical protein
MLENSLNQGAGLHAIASRAVPRLIAVASHGDAHSELPLLWHLCTALAGMDASPLVVLDGTTAESSANPGLSHLLDDGCQPFDTRSEQASWVVLPAAIGLQSLSLPDHGAALALRDLAEVLSGVGVVIIYAEADTLIALLADSGAEPLLAVSSSRTSRVTAYQAMKRMLLNAGLRPTIATMVCDPIQSAFSEGQALSTNLQDCAMYFLDYQLDAHTLATEPQHPAPDMHRLARRLLERAMPLQHNPSLTFGRHRLDMSTTLVGSH